jgi:hypothetical protein
MEIKVIDRDWKEVWVEKLEIIEKLIKPVKGENKVRSSMSYNVHHKGSRDWDPTLF